MKQYIILLLAMPLLFAACNRGDDSPPAATGSKEQLVAGKWMIVGARITTNVNGAETMQDLYATLLPCKKDNLTIYQADNRLVEDENTIKCDTGQQVDKGTWALSEDRTKIIITPVNGPEVIQTIDQFDNTILKLSTAQTQSANGVTVTYTYSETFTHIN